MKNAVLNVHATCVCLGASGAPFRASSYAGVLLLGRSGAGKSDLALRMIAAGAVLVADDRVELFLKNRRLFAQPPKRLAGLFEVRGLGIVETKYRASAPIALAVELVERLERMPDHGRYAPAGLPLPAGVRPPLIRIVPGEGSAPAKIAAAVAAFAGKGFRHNVKPD